MKTPAQIALEQHAYQTERMAGLGQQNQDRAVALPGVDLRDIPFSSVPFFGYDHSQETSQLSHYIGDWLGLDTPALQAVKTAALLHDIGRTLPWDSRGLPEPGHHVHSANLAVTFLKSQNETWAKQGLIEEVGWLIANHALTLEGELPRDKRLQALWDADSFEAARLGVGTSAGMKLFRTRMARLCTDWAKEKQNQKKWLTHRGWK